MSALYLVIVNPPDRLDTVMFVHNASAIYGGENLPNPREFFVRPIGKIGFRRPFVTFMYALVLSCLTLLGLLSLASNLCGLSSSMGPVGFSKVLSGVLLVALFAKYMEWSAIWNAWIVISILEEKHGDIALGVAAYLCRGSRRKGLALMLVLFIRRLALRQFCLNFTGHSEESGFLQRLCKSI
ncbi:hypothetical protein ACJRO7_035359 [Eucalyptus globulus]|uniref:Uncharacterized protein n=1 Tax=Eucalyptus globulus TaxID=34317 RepID=A0ABD3J8M9_EUCGL